VRYTLAAVEHEIRNPLTAVGGFVRMLAKTIDPTSYQGKYIKVILFETQKLEQALKGIGQMLER
jgi:two-component system, sporulation sensor kinase E